MPLSVLDRFRDTFPDTPLPPETEHNLAQMPLDSTCGDDCAMAIQNASMVLSDIQNAFASFRPDLINGLALITASVVQCFITG